MAAAVADMLIGCIGPKTDKAASDTKTSTKSTLETALAVFDAFARCLNAGKSTSAETSTAARPPVATQAQPQVPIPMSAGGPNGVFEPFEPFRTFGPEAFRAFGEGRGGGGGAVHATRIAPQAYAGVPAGPDAFFFGRGAGPDFGPAAVFDHEFTCTFGDDDLPEVVSDGIDGNGFCEEQGEYDLTPTMPLRRRGSKNRTKIQAPKGKGKKATANQSFFEWVQSLVCCL